MEGEEVNSHCGGERVIFFMDYVMYFLLAVVKELGLLGVLTVYYFQGCGTCYVELTSRKLTKVVWLQ